MSKSFVITKTKNNTYMVSWPKWDNIRKFDTKKKLLDVLFEDIGSDTVGIGILPGLLSDCEIDTMWINSTTWSQDVNGDYAAYLEDMYEIKGVAFTSENEAVKFQDFLEKKYIWKMLSE